MTAPALSIRHLGKTFPGQVALRDVSFDVAAGEVHALVGENGCGKSTLIKSLSGYHQPDPGSEIEVAGTPLPMPHSPRQAREVGLAFVHQDLGLIETGSVLENLAYGHGYEVAPGWRIKWRAEQRIARELLEEFEVPVRPNTVVGDLSQANKTLVAIVRGLRDAGDGGRLLVLDEPTAALPASEASRLFDFVRRLQKRGLAIIYVSHRLNEVFEISQRITVLRDAGLVGTFDAAELDERSLVHHIIGKSLAEYVPTPRQTVRSEVLLEVEGLCGPRLRSISFKVAKGEIVGVAGLLGSGRSELGRIVAGAQRAEAGTMKLGGEVVAWRDPRAAIEAGVSLVPEDRRREGGVMTMSVGSNITLPDARSFFRGGILRRRQERREAAQLIDRYDVRPRDASRPLFQLSGGNQQKVVLAKWLRLAPRLVVFDEPVQGVDVGSKAQIYERIEQAAEAGCGVLLIDSDFEDLARVCNKVIVLYRGSMVAVLSGEFSREQILQHVYVNEEEAA